MVVYRGNVDRLGEVREAMGIPDEDKGPAWLRDYGAGSGHTKVDSYGWVDGGALAVDLKSLVDFAAALEKEHKLDYRPHAEKVFTDMGAKPNDPPADFLELVSSMTLHQNLLVETSDALCKHDEAVLAFVAAAREISKKYGEADALASAKTKDVQANLTEAAPVPPKTGTTIVTPPKDDTATDNPEAY